MKLNLFLVFFSLYVIILSIIYFIKCFNMCVQTQQNQKKGNIIKHFTVADTKKNEIYFRNINMYCDN